MGAWSKDASDALHPVYEHGQTVNRASRSKTDGHGSAWIGMPAAHSAFFGAESIVNLICRRMDSARALDPRGSVSAFGSADCVADCTVLQIGRCAVHASTVPSASALVAPVPLWRLLSTARAAETERDCAFLLFSTAHNPCHMSQRVQLPHFSGGAAWTCAQHQNNEEQRPCAGVLYIRDTHGTCRVGPASAAARTKAAARRSKQ